MTLHAHAVVWIDYRVAKIFDFNREDTEGQNIHHWHAEKQIHHKAGSVGSGHTVEDEAYFRAVAEALRGPREIVIVGPGHAKWQLHAHLNLHAPEISRRVMAVVDADHPSDAQIVESAQKYFSDINRMTPQITTPKQHPG